MKQNPSRISGKSRSPKRTSAASTWLTASQSPQALASPASIFLISAREATRRLGVKPATLYAYVSRGLLRSAGVPGSRKRRYFAEDVERLKRLRRSGRRAGAPPAPFDSLAPVLDSAICLVESGRLYYRGVDVAGLADRANLEEIARLLWGSDTIHPFAVRGLSAELLRWLKDVAPTLSPIERARFVLVELATQDIGALDISSESVVRTGGRLLPALVAAITGATPTNAPISEQLATAWGLDGNGADLIRRCLVLAADHELNTSTYVARCVASTGASPYTAVIAALGALSGPRHGGQANDAETLLRELVDSRDKMSVVAGRLQRGESIPGFGHALYPNGDPRAINILNALNTPKLARRSSAIIKLVGQISDLIGRRPNFDFALGAVSSVFDLPRGSGLGIFLVGRTVGWIAHAIEQYNTGVLIRPRARYVGVLPVPEDISWSITSQGEKAASSD